MSLRSRLRPRPFDEDAFLWEEAAIGAVTEEKSLSFTEAERMALGLFEAVGLPSSLLLEDPNERFAKFIDNKALFNAAQQAGTARQVNSDDFTNHFYELKPKGGRLAFETNPKDTPALVRITVEPGRASPLVSGLLIMVGRIGGVSVKELASMPMTEPLRANQMGNRYFRLITDNDLGSSHDVACLVAWTEPDGAPKRVELMAWPVEKLRSSAA